MTSRPIIVDFIAVFLNNERTLTAIFEKRNLFILNPKHVRFV